ncbi:MAG TPA: hypothetical protein VHE78_11915 [Gemmatimonadaceae bacterium]|nr:hypothetical protein [Gemmatimonadaceae bacterium]
MIALVLVAQLAAAAVHDTATYSSPAVRRLVAEAARLNGIVPPSLGRYHAMLETEITLGSRNSAGMEVAESVEQMASDLTWARTGDFEQHLVGYRSQSRGAQFASIGLFRYPWVVPSLYGNRLALVFGRDTTRRGPPPAVAGGGRATDPAQRPAGERVTTSRRQPGTTYAMHPLGADRERLYRFSGGDTVENLKVGDRVIRIVKLEVLAKEPLPPRTTVFTGEIDLDADRKHMVRMRGTFATTVPTPAGPLRVLAISQLEGAIFVELVNSEVNQEYWLPSYQRVDVHAVAATAGDAKAVFRIVSRFHDYMVTLPEGTLGISATDTLRARPHVLSIAPRDSLARFNAWHEEMGVASASVNADDFDDVAPPRWRATGTPFVRLQVERLSDLVRFNRVEGLFTGLGASARMRDAAPGLTLRALAGYAWAEGTVRGRASAELDRGEWTYLAQAGRSLDMTNDFRNPFTQGLTVGSLFGMDDFDYVDRYSAGAAVTRTLARRRALARLEVGWADDRPAVEHLTHSPFGRSEYLANRGVTPGQYLRSAIILQWRPDVSAEFMRPGFGAHLAYMRGDGELNFQRAELMLNTRRNTGRWTFASRLDAGTVLGTPPPQQLFELGGQNLPGYDYKEFAGDQAVVLRGIVMYRLNVLQAPWRLTQRFWLPAPAPALSVALQSGWTGVSNDAARAAITRLGTKLVVDSLGRAFSAPVSRVTGNAMGSVALGIRVFGGSVGLSLERAVDHAAPWRFRVEFGQD